MTLHDYLIDHSDFDWAHLLSGWKSLLPPKFTLWMMNRFGDLFLILRDGSVHMLDLGADSLTRLAESRDDFARMIDEDDNADYWLMIPLVDRLVEAGVLLKPGECYSFLTPPVLGGDYTIENTVVLPISEHFGVYGSYHDQLRGVPDGTKVVIKVAKPPDSHSACLPLETSMGFRRKCKDQRAWQEWLDEHRETLVRCSLPDFVFSDKLTWLRFLEHGGWHPQPRWGVGMLSSHHAAALCEFIESQYGNDRYRSLLRNLDDVRRKSST